MYNHRDIQNLQAKFASPARKFKALEWFEALMIIPYKIIWLCQLLKKFV